MPQFEFTTEAWISLGILILAAGVALALLVYVVRKARAAGPATAEPGDADGGEEAPGAPPARTLEAGETATLAELLEGGRDPEPYLMRFVDDANGERAGESITVHEEKLVLKRGEGFAAVPLTQVIVEGEHVRTAEDVDWDAAEKEGDAWRSAGENPLDTTGSDENGANA